MPTLAFKTPKGVINLRLPVITGLPLTQTSYYKTSSAADVISKAESLNMEIADATYLANLPFFYYNTTSLNNATANFNLVDLVDYDDFSIFNESWECNDLRITWKQPSGTNKVVYGRLTRPNGTELTSDDVYQFILKPTSQESTIYMQFCICYLEPEDKYVYIAGFTNLNQFRVTNDTNCYWYRQYLNRANFNNAIQTEFDNLVRGNSSGGGGGIVPDPSPDPYDPSGDGSGYSSGGSAADGGTGGGYNPTGTGTTGNGGLHDDTSDTVPTPSLPSDATISSGLFTAYNPSASQLASFASALWNMQPDDINDVLRFLFGGDAFNAIIGLHLLPVAPSTGGSPNIKLGNWDTGVPAPKIISQYKQVPFGSILLPEYWGNCIDYAPYTKIQLALPYIGIVDVDTDDVLGSTNTLAYNIDVLSGAICATLHCVKGNLNSVIYQWSGACAVSLPFSGASYNSVLGAIAGIAAAGMGFASMAAGPIGAALPAAALAAGGGAFGAGSAASIMGTMKGKVQKSGSFGANSGALGIMTPYFILTRPVQSVPETWQADKGYPSNISAQLGTLTGYTEVSEINLECSGTEAEKNEIIDLLKKGVLF